MTCTCAVKGKVFLAVLLPLQERNSTGKKLGFCHHHLPMKISYGVPQFPYFKRNGSTVLFCNAVEKLNLFPLQKLQRNLVPFHKTSQAQKPSLSYIFKS